jgi:hypothetical protein
MVPVLFGILLLTYWGGRSSAAGWLLVGLMAAVFSWNAVLWLGSRILRALDHASKEPVTAAASH